MKAIIQITFIIVVLTSCRKDPEFTVLKPEIPDEIPVGFDTLDLNKFTIVIPKAWTYVPLSGIDSYVGKFELNDTDYIAFDYGKYSNELNVDSTTHEIYYTTIDDKNAKIVKAINPENGTTGVYFSNVGLYYPGLYKRFNLYGTNLSGASQQQVLAAIETLDFVE